MNQLAVKVCGEKNCLTEFSSNLPGAPGLWDEEDNCCTRSTNHISRIVVIALILFATKNEFLWTSGGAARRGLASTGKALAGTTRIVKAMGFTSATWTALKGICWIVRETYFLFLAHGIPCQNIQTTLRPWWVFLQHISLNHMLLIPQKYVSMQGRNLALFPLGLNE